MASKKERKTQEVDFQEPVSTLKAAVISLHL